MQDYHRWPVCRQGYITGGLYAGRVITGGLYAARIVLCVVELKTDYFFFRPSRAHGGTKVYLQFEMLLIKGLVIQAEVVSSHH